MGQLNVEKIFRPKNHWMASWESNGRDPVSTEPKKSYTDAVEALVAELGAYYERLCSEVERLEMKLDSNNQRRGGGRPSGLVDVARQIQTNKISRLEQEIRTLRAAEIDAARKYSALDAEAHRLRQALSAATEVQQTLDSTPSPAERRAAATADFANTKAGMGELKTAHAYAQVSLAWSAIVANEKSKN